VRKNVIYVSVLLVLGVVILVVGAAGGKVLFLAIGILVTLLSLAAFGQLYRLRRLSYAEPGTTRSKVVKQNAVAFTVQQYTDAGWQVAERTPVATDGKQQTVKLTFRKV
jgi:uncharacterized protein (DUF58 family)